MAWVQGASTLHDFRRSTHVIELCVRSSLPRCRRVLLRCELLLQHPKAVDTCSIKRVGMLRILERVRVLLVPFVHDSGRIFPPDTESVFLIFFILLSGNSHRKVERQGSLLHIIPWRKYPRSKTSRSFCRMVCHDSACDDRTQNL